MSSVWANGWKTTNEASDIQRSMAPDSSRSPPAAVQATKMPTQEALAADCNWQDDEPLQLTPPASGTQRLVRGEARHIEAAVNW